MSRDPTPGRDSGFDQSGPSGPTSLHDPAALGALARLGWVMLEAVPPLEAQVAELLSPLGTLMPQYGQRKFWAVEARDSGKGTSLGNLALRLHTELAEFESPPDYVALYAERPAAEGGALLLCDVRPFLASLTAPELGTLLTAEMTVKAEGSIADRYGDFSYTGPILSPSPFGLRLRLDQHFIDRNGPPAVRDFRDRLMVYAERTTVEVRQPRASLIIWDNRSVLHGRTAFEDGARRLWRCCIRGRS
jgi:alpha-ketoglutarate-dependent taurine dioxygenase